MQLRVVDSNGVALGAGEAFCARVMVGESFTAAPMIASDPNATYPVAAGTPVFVGAAPCPDEPFSFAPVWSWGADLSLGQRDLGAPAIVLEPGETRVIEVMVGAAELSGTIAGADVAARCSVEAVPVGSPFPAPVRGTIDGNTYTVTVAPGDWITRAKCEANAYAYGPGDVDHLEDAQPVSVEDGESQTGIDLTPARTEDVSAFLALRINESSLDIPFCVDYTTADGSIVDRVYWRTGANFTSVSNRVPHNSYHVRFWDCAGGDFESRWFPYSPNRGGAATIVVPSGEFEVTVDGLVQLVADPTLTCNGLPATLVGTEERDRLYGTDGADVILALGGNDVVRGGDGRDTICGGDGRDNLFGGAQPDTILGGQARDRIKGGTGGDELRGEKGRDLVIGGFGNDELFGNGGTADTLDGREGNDRCVDPAPTTIRIDCETE